MTRYPPEERQRIYDEAREAIEAADRTLDAPRPEYVPPPEDKVAKWKREADEQAARFARERAEPWPLTDYEAARLERSLAEQKDFTKRLLAGVVAALRAEHSEQFGAFADELSKRLGDEISELLELGKPRTKAKTNGGEIIDLPSWPLVRKQRA